MQIKHSGSELIAGAEIAVAMAMDPRRNGESTGRELGLWVVVCGLEFEDEGSGARRPGRFGESLQPRNYNGTSDHGAAWNLQSGSSGFPGVEEGSEFRA